MPNDKGMEFTNPNYSLDKPQSDEKSSAYYYLTALDKLQQKLLKLYKDDLTNCYNRNFYENFKSDNFDSKRDSDNLSIVFVDVNNLKQTNDYIGHDAGDELIKNTAKFLKSNFRKEDLVVRFGGDEFVVICRNHEKDFNFRNNFPKKITERLGDNPPVDFAFGIAIYNKDQDSFDLDKTTDRADALMYQKKKEMKS